MPQLGVVVVMVVPVCTIIVHGYEARILWNEVLCSHA
jgi:hypothetical protein